MEHLTTESTATPSFMEWPESKNVESTQYTKEEKILVVKFRSGGIYRYNNFPADQWEELLKAESVGSFINKHVRGNYTTEKIS